MSSEQQEPSQSERIFGAIRGKQELDDAIRLFTLSMQMMVGGLTKFNLEIVRKTLKATRDVVSGIEEMFEKVEGARSFEHAEHIVAQIMERMKKETTPLEE